MSISNRTLYSYLILIVFTINGCQTLSLQARTNKLGAKYETPFNSAILDEIALRKKIVGNTVIGKSPKDNQEYAEFYLPNGTFKGLWGRQSYIGMWAISGYLLCVEYGFDRPVCFMLSVDGSGVTLHGLEGKILRKATLLPGNAKEL